MRTIIILTYFDELEFPIHGTTFHMYEMGLQLQKLGFDVIFYNPFNFDNVSVKILESKYINKLPMTNEFSIYDNILLTSNFTFRCIPYYDIRQAKICIHLITDIFKAKIEQYLQLKHNTFIFSNKMMWLYDNRLISCWDNPDDIPIMNRIINNRYRKMVYKWGLLENSYYIENSNILPSKKWLIYSGIHKGLSTLELIDQAIQYCDSLNLDYDIDTLNIRSPESYYAGLVYAKNQDFSGRLPFEFAMHNKPVKFIGTNKFYRDYLNISLETTQLEIPRLDISNLASYLESV